MRTFVDGFLLSGAFDVVQPSKVWYIYFSVVGFVSCITVVSSEAKHMADNLGNVVIRLSVSLTRSIVTDGAPYVIPTDLESSSSVVDVSKTVDETNSACIKACFI